MPTDDEMNLDERLKYLRRMARRYRQARKAEKGLLLDEMEHVTGLNRKMLIRRMHSDLVRHPRKRQRSRTYGAHVDDALRVIAESLDEISAERLTPNLVWLARCLGSFGEIAVDEALLTQLARISTSTMAHILQRIGQDEPRLPRQGPQAANRVRREAPMRRIPWDEQEQGHFEVDLVYHSGSVVGGDHVHTVQMIDVATGWSERAAVLGRSYLVMQDAFRRIVQRLPFPILELHPDNGSEFFNRAMVDFWGELIQGVKLSRSRPWQKNDNRFVEQKNATLVRAYLGHERLDSAAQTRALNALYDDMWRYYNFFQPVMRLVGKTHTQDPHGATHVRRHYDQARTPFDRLCATGVLPSQQQQALARQRDQINPRQLRRAIYEQIQRLFRIPGAKPGLTEDVYTTLMTPIPD